MQNFLAWLNSPFQAGMSVPRYFAFVGFIIACLMVWAMILKRLESI